MNDMNKVGIVGYGITPFTKDDKKIGSILLDSAKELFQNNSQKRATGIPNAFVQWNLLWIFASTRNSLLQPSRLLRQIITSPILDICWKFKSAYPKKQD